MTLTNKIKNNRGFSLVEFLIVIGILAVIAIIAVPITVGVINSSNKQNDEVLASTYSEYMQKFATEQVGSIGYYPTLKDDGVGSDYDILKNSSGKGSYPGITQLDSRINEMNEDEIWNLIRKEACIAISAYSGEELADPYNYFIEKPTDSSMAFVYYYLTGTIALESVEKMEDSKISVEQVNNGAIDTEDYWVYLDRKGGSGKAIGTGEATRDFYVKVVQFGTGLPLGGAKVTISPYGSSTGTTRSATTNETGMLVFRDVYDEIETSATKLGALDWWSAMHYSEFEYKINLATNPGKGTLANPFIITLKMGTLGSLEFYEQYKTYAYNPSGTSFATRVEKIDWYNDFQTIFTVKEDSLTGIDETYNSSTPEHNPLELLGDQNKDGEFCFLIYGDYDMVIKNSTINNKTSAKNPYFADYHEEITSDVYGIYNTANPKEYPSMTTPYAYPVVLKRSDTLIKGQIMAENSEQPLHGTKTGLFASYDGSKNTKSVTIETYVYAVNTRDKSDYYVSNILANPSTVNGNLVYDYELYLNGKYDGTQEYEIFLCTVYGTKDSSVISGKTVNKMTVAAWPTKISADGSIYELKTSTKEYVQINLESDVRTADSVTIKVYEKRGSINRYLDCTATLTRKGYSTYTNGLTKYSGSVEENTSNQYIQLSGVKQGFYNLTIDFDDTHAGDYPDIDGIPLPVIIDDNNEIIIELDPVNIQYSITIHPVTAGGSDITPDNNLLGANSTYGWEKISVGVTIGGVNLADNGFAIDVDTSTLSANKALVTFTYGKTTKGMTVTQSVKCFNSANKLTVTGAIGTNMSSGDKYENSFKIYRLEDERNSTNQHQIGAWTITSDNVNHWELCSRCLWIRFQQPHFQGEDEAGNITYNMQTYYASAYTSDNASVGTQHNKHCTWCNQYDKAENCSGGSWVKYYDSYTTNAAHSSVHSGKTDHTLKAYQSSVSTSRHYKYCSLCKQRWSQAAHDMECTDSVTVSCTEAGYEVWTCKDCDYSYRVDAPAPGHKYNEGFYYGRLNEDNCLDKVTTKVCTVCGYNPGRTTTCYIPSVHDIGSDNRWGDTWNRRFLNWAGHNNDCMTDVSYRTATKTHSLEVEGNNYTYTGGYYSWRACQHGTREYSVAKSNGTYSATAGANGKIFSAPNPNPKSGYTRIDKRFNMQTHAYTYLQKDNGDWTFRIYTDTAALDDVGGSLFLLAGENSAPVFNGTFTQACGGYSNAKCSISLCCNKFQWPDDATIYNSIDANYQTKWFSCFNTCNAYTTVNTTP